MDKWSLNAVNFGDPSLNLSSSVKKEEEKPCPTGVVHLPHSQLVVRVLLPECLGPEARWLGSDVAWLLGSRAPFKKLLGKRVSTGWAKYHGVLCPQDALQMAFLDHGLGNTTVSTTYMISLIYWGFAARREEWQRVAAAQLLVDLVNLTVMTRPGFQLYMPQPGAPLIEVDELGCFDLQSLMGLAKCEPASRTTTSSVSRSWCILDMLTRGSGHLHQLPVPCASQRLHLAHFIVAVLTPEHGFPGWWTDIAVWFLRQLSALVNGEAPRMMQGQTMPPERPSASEVGSASTTDQFEDEDPGLTWLPSVVALEAALHRCDS